MVLDVEAGDILPAKEAIEIMDQVDLGPNIDVPPIPEEAFSENIPEDEKEFYRDEI